MFLKPNTQWPQNQGKVLPTVEAQISADNQFLSVRFSVEEPEDCFRAEVAEDNGRSWEDSCVELFLLNPANPSEYCNFECTSRGFILSAKGPDRYTREVQPLEKLATIQRELTPAKHQDGKVSWGIAIKIPASFFGLDSFQGKDILGNLYKCGDKSNCPHYLSLFPIETEKPDFHRPEFFRDLLTAGK